eukprot:359802-Chlamydomonas_euryale.AAC.10
MCLRGQGAARAAVAAAAEAAAAGKRLTWTPAAPSPPCGRSHASAAAWPRRRRPAVPLPARRRQPPHPIVGSWAAVPAALPSSFRAPCP